MIIERQTVMRTWVMRLYSKDEKRYADLISSQNGYEVEMYEDDKHVKRQQCWEHTRRYAEDCAENWVEGIIK